MPKLKKTNKVAGSPAVSTVVTLNGVSVDFAQMVADAQERQLADTYLPAALSALTSSKVTKSLIVAGPDGLVVAHDRARALVAQMAQVGREKYGLGDSISATVLSEAFLAELEKVRTLRQQKADYKAKSKKSAVDGAAKSAKPDMAVGGGGEDRATRASKGISAAAERPMASLLGPEGKSTGTAAMSGLTETQKDTRASQAQSTMLDVPERPSSTVPVSIKFPKPQTAAVTEPLRGNGWDLDRASMTWRPKEGASFPNELRKIVSDANGTLNS